MRLFCLISFFCALGCAQPSQSAPSTCQTHYQVLLKEDGTVNFAGNDIEISELGAALETESNDCGDKIVVFVGAGSQNSSNESREHYMRIFEIIGDSAAVKSVGVVTEKVGDE